MPVSLLARMKSTASNE